MYLTSAVGVTRGCNDVCQNSGVHEPPGHGKLPALHCTYSLFCMTCHPSSLPGPVKPSMTAGSPTVATASMVLPVEAHMAPTSMPPVPP